MLSCSIPVAVLLKCQQIDNNPWLSHQWQALGVVPFVQSNEQEPVLVAEDSTSKTYRYQGFNIEIIADELESYYQNLSSENAGVFIVCHPDNDGNPKPFLVTLSYDEAAVYLETDEIVYSVAIDLQIYQKIEKFVLENYSPPSRKKRRLTAGTAGQHYAEESKFD